MFYRGRAGGTEIGRVSRRLIVRADLQLSYPVGLVLEGIRLPAALRLPEQ